MTSLPTLPHFILESILVNCTFDSIVHLASTSKTLRKIITNYYKPYCIQASSHVFDTVDHTRINWILIHRCLQLDMTKMPLHSGFGFIANHYTAKVGRTIVTDTRIIIGHIIKTKLIGGIAYCNGVTTYRHYDPKFDNSRQVVRDVNHSRYLRSKPSSWLKSQASR